MTTFETLTALQTEVGTRRAGSDGERKAQDWLRARCEALGLHVELDEFKFIGSERYRPLVSLFTLLMIGVSVALIVSGQFTLGLLPFAAMFIYFSFFAKNLELRLANTPSRNVLAGLGRSVSEYMNDPQKGAAVLVCAHYDTPRNMPAFLAPLRGSLRFFGPLGLFGMILLVGVWALSMLCIFSGSDTCQEFTVKLAGILGPAALILNAPYFSFMLIASLYNLFGKKTDAPGADDNGSGTALVLEVARRLKENPPENTDIFFAFWGAEERGLFGSRQFIRRYAGQFDRRNLYVLNADCVGVGQTLTVHSGQGTWKHKPTDPLTVQRIERLAAEFNIPTVRSWESIISGGSSDHAAWVERGFRQVVSLLRENQRPPTLPARLVAALLRIPDANTLELKHIHTPADTLEVIQAPVLEVTTDMAEAYVREVADL